MLGMVMGLVLLGGPGIAGPTPVFPDAAITMRARILFLTHPQLDARGVHVDTSSGRVTLHGRVPDEPTRMRVAAETLRLPGVRGVRNLVQVTALPDSNVVSHDDALRREVEAALAACPRSSDEKPRVTSVHHGVVTLEGVTSLRDGFHAVSAVAGVRGVRRVQLASALEP
ncbi:MAG: BON domain-containing protein [Myxococcota bacterium]